MRKGIVILIAIIAMMVCEYRFIMTNLRPYYGDDGFVIIEFMGNADSYYAEPIFSAE